MQSNAIDRVTMAKSRNLGLCCSNTDTYLPLPLLTAFTDSAESLALTTNRQPHPMELVSLAEERLGGWVSVVFSHPTPTWVCRLELCSQTSLFPQRTTTMGTLLPSLRRDSPWDENKSCWTRTLRHQRNADMQAHSHCVLGCAILSSNGFAKSMSVTSLLGECHQATSNVFGTRTRYHADNLSSVGLPV